MRDMRFYRARAVTVHLAEGADCDGEVDAKDLGMTFPHEHLLLDLTCCFTMPEEASKRYLANSKVEMSNLGTSTG